MPIASSRTASTAASASAAASATAHGFEALDLEARYRFYAGEWLIVETDAGALIERGGGSGVTVQGGLVLGDIVGVMAGVDRRGDTTVGWLGLRVGAPIIVMTVDMVIR
jgi:hypothetical protein